MLVFANAVHFGLHTQPGKDGSCCNPSFQDLIVGVVLDVALVSLIAPRAVLGAKPMAVKGGGAKKHT